MAKFACVDPKGGHSADYLTEIIRLDHYTYGEETVIRWCKCCGAITVDLEVDRRLCKPFMRWPSYKSMD